MSRCIVKVHLTLNWIVCEPIWKRSQFCFRFHSNTNEPISHTPTPMSDTVISTIIYHTTIPVVNICRWTHADVSLQICMYHPSEHCTCVSHPSVITVIDTRLWSSALTDTIPLKSEVINVIIIEAAQFYERWIWKCRQVLCRNNRIEGLFLKLLQDCNYKNSILKSNC